MATLLRPDQAERHKYQKIRHRHLLDTDSRQLAESRWVVDSHLRPVVDSPPIGADNHRHTFLVVVDIRLVKDIRLVEDIRLVVDSHLDNLYLGL